MKVFKSAFHDRRQQLVKELREKGISNEALLDAIGKIPRERFVDPAFVQHAYEDTAFPIGEMQTISQPYTVAFMTEALALKRGEKVLEIGTGSGYQAAVLAEMGSRVFTIERHTSLLADARQRLDLLGYDRVLSRVGDGSRGWNEYAPFDAIIVTAGAPDVPESLTKQLNASGGRMIIPVGNQEMQRMYLIRRNGDDLTGEELPEFKFVPLIGKEGWADR